MHIPTVVSVLWLLSQHAEFVFAASAISNDRYPLLDSISTSGLPVAAQASSVPAVGRALVASDTVPPNTVLSVTVNSLSETTIPPSNTVLSITVVSSGNTVPPTGPASGSTVLPSSTTLHPSTTLRPSSSTGHSSTLVPVPSTTQIGWNPNPAPSPGAASETFVTGTSTKVIAVPTATTVVIIGTATITLAPGGTPVNGPVPPGITQPGAVTPTWNPNIIPPTSVSSVTFIAPPSYTSVVAVPTASNSPPKNVTGPPGDKNNNGDDWWLLLFPGIVGGLLPPDISIPGGTTPAATPPASWTGSWSNPGPTSTPVKSQSASKITSASSAAHSSSESSASAHSSSSSSTTCPTPVPTYSLPDDSENADWEAEGTDPDRRRRSSAAAESSLQRRDNRHISVNTCSITVTNTHAVDLAAGPYLSIGPKVPIGVGATLTVTQVNSRPRGNGVGEVAQEHVFELGYINQFFQEALTAGVSCTWIQDNVFNFVRADGSNLGVALLNAIDTTQNMVWVDKPMNQAKSNVVNQNKATPGDPPQSVTMRRFVSFAADQNKMQDIEYFTRNFVALGSYFGSTAAIFRATALRVQNLLAEITPDSAEANLPVEFNRFLNSLLATYSAGCTSRATNVYNFYVNKMNSIATPANPVPACFPLFHRPGGLPTPQGFNFQNLMPPAPTLPTCDIPGTQGRMSVGQDAQGNPVYALGTYRIMGSGNTQFYALGTATSLAGMHFVANNLASNFGASCQGVYQIVNHLPGAGLIDANVALSCNGRRGNSVVAPFDFVVNGQGLKCVLLNQNDGSGNFFAICGPSAADANRCGNAVLQTQLPTSPRAALSTPTFAFHPQ